MTHIIHVPRFRDAVLPLSIRASFGGRYSVRTGKNLGCIDAASGLWIPGRDVITREIGPWCNLITNNGLDNLAVWDGDEATQYCHVGTGTTAEAVGDTALETFLASTNNTQSNSESAQGSAPYYGKWIHTDRFNPGVGTGNISEIGFSPQSGTGDITSRSLVKDGVGSPTTITKLSDEWLDVTYEMRLYPDHVSVDGTGTVDYSGTSYNYTIRASDVTDSAQWAPRDMKAVWNNTNIPGRAFSSDAALGAVTSGMTATGQDQIDAGGGTSASNGTYTPGTYSRTLTMVVGPTQGNVSDGGGAGVKGLELYLEFGTYQVLFDAVVPKDNTKVWTVPVSISWTRATIP